jgi:hypothetical protein
VTGMVISESENVRFRDPEFGDIVLVAYSRCAVWHGSWRTSFLYSGADDQVVLCNGDESRCVSIPFNSEIIIFDFEDEEREEARLGTLDGRMSFMPGVVASYSEMLLASNQNLALEQHSERKRNVRSGGNRKTRGR